jgi:hypothetical protein
MNQKCFLAIKAVVILYSFLFAVSGCTPPTKYPVIERPIHTEPPVIPNRTIQTPPKRSSDGSSDWIPAAATERRWSAIIIHHTATTNGNAAKINDEHLKRGWEGIGYDFLIGNGTDSDDGEVEVTFRWSRQIQGAHCGGTPNNWANEEGIGICLVGNFDETVPTAKQMQSLVKLVRFLQQRYGIPNNRIYGHGTTPGGHQTDCPGNNFPMWRFKSML